MIFDISHIRFTLTDEGTFSLTAPGGDKPDRKLFTGFVSDDMVAELRELADAIEKVNA